MLSQSYQNNFQCFLEILRNNKIPHCAVAGTLLGIVRNNNFIPHDEDVDIGVPIEYKNAVLDILKNTDWYIYCAWRRELGIIRHGFTKKESKVDIFFLESDELNTYIYSYKRNPLHGVWDIEWRMSFPKECFSEFKPNNINSIPLPIPVGYEKILELEYGDWKTENKNWNTYNAPAYDKNYREIAIIIPNFLRNDKLKKTIESIKTTFSNEWYRLYIVDQGCFSADMKQLYESLNKKGHFATYIPFNAGLSFSRNYLVNKTTEPYIFLIDNDFIISKTTNLSNFINILNTDDSIGVVGGKLYGHEDYNYDLYLKNEHLYYVKPTKTLIKTKNSFIQPSIEFQYCDIVLNFALFKRDIFKQISWDNNLKLAEHTDFYLRLKQNTKWRVAFTETVSAEHLSTPDSTDYIALRRSINGDIYYKKLLNKWNIKNENNIIKLDGVIQ